MKKNIKMPYALDIQYIVNYYCLGMTVNNYASSNLHQSYYNPRALPYISVSFKQKGVILPSVRGTSKDTLEDSLLLFFQKTDVFNHILNTFKGNKKLNTYMVRSSIESYFQD